MQGILLTLGVFVLLAGLACAECPLGLGGGTTYVVDARGVLTLTACDQTWLRGVAHGRQLRILLNHMTFIVEPAAPPTLGGGGISLAPQGAQIVR